MTKEVFLEIWQRRFLSGYMKHPEIDLGEVVAALKKADNLNVLIGLEEGGGEVDLVKVDDDGYWFFDCCKESPKERRSFCYDEDAFHARKLNPPMNSVERKAHCLSAHIINEEDFLLLTSLGEFDVKSQDWLKTDPEFRKRGDALFGCTRHGRAFVYFNKAESYYSVRGFRCKVKIAK